jgi:hypothetical protein
MKESTKVSIIFFITLMMGMLSIFLLLLLANISKFKSKFKSKSDSDSENVDENKEDCFLWNGSKCVYKKTLLIIGSVSLIIFISLLLYLRYITISTDDKLSKRSVLNQISKFVNKITTHSKK